MGGAGEHHIKQNTSDLEPFLWLSSSLREYMVLCGIGGQEGNCAPPHPLSSASSVISSGGRGRHRPLQPGLYKSRVKRECGHLFPERGPLSKAWVG